MKQGHALPLPPLREPVRMTQFEVRPWLEIGGTTVISGVVAIVALTQEHFALAAAILGLLTPLILVTAWLVRSEMTARQTQKDLAALIARADRQDATIQQLIAHLPRRKGDREAAPWG